MSDIQDEAAETQHVIGQAEVAAIDATVEGDALTGGLAWAGVADEGVDGVARDGELGGAAVAGSRTEGAGDAR